MCCKAHVVTRRCVDGKAQLDGAVNSEVSRLCLEAELSLTESVRLQGDQGLRFWWRGRSPVPPSSQAITSRARFSFLTSCSAPRLCQISKPDLAQGDSRGGRECGTRTHGAVCVFDDLQAAAAAAAALV